MKKIVNKMTRRKLDITSLDFIKKSLILLECRMYIDLHSNVNFTNILNQKQQDDEKSDIEDKNIIRISSVPKDDIFKKTTLIFKKKQGGGILTNLTKGIFW